MLVFFISLKTTSPFTTTQSKDLETYLKVEKVDNLSKRTKGYLISLLRLYFSKEKKKLHLQVFIP